jgi:beta-lactam-binding protein with PASTA domain
MRTCQSCGKQNPPDQDFCSCGEYLRWDPTGFVEAVTPEMAAAAAAEAPPAEPAAPAAQPPAAAAPPAPAAPQPAAAPPPPRAPEPVAAGPNKTQVQGAVPPPPAAEPAAEPEQAPATITLRLPDEDAVKGETLALGVHPGDRARVRALIRNQSGIVDNYQLTVQGLPAEWFSVLPDTVYLVPYGSGGTYEQEVEIHFHPPRSAEAEARIWELQVVAHSRAQERTAASEPLLLGIQPFEQHETKVKPERASGRRKADFKVAVRNKANAPVYVAFAAKESDDELGFKFNPPAAEVAPGETVETKLRVRPPKQIWIGRPTERRIDVQTKSGDEAHALEAAAQAGEQDDGQDGGGLGGKIGGKRVPGVHGPKFYKPQVYKPNVHLGPGGIQVQKPMVRGPQMVGPQARGANLNLNQLKMPGAQKPPDISGPLLPTQAVFRQKPWLPWWVAIVIPLLALLALLLFLFLPKNTEVPDVVGKKSAFEAEKLITEAGLRLAPEPDEKVNNKVPPGTVLRQAPNAGETVEEDSEVALLVAVGNGKASVPNVVGQTTPEAEKTLRDAGLTLGQATPQPVDPKLKIKSQIPAEKEVLQQGAPVDIFLAVPKEGGGAVAGGGGEGEPEGGEEGGDNGGGGGGDGGPSVVPEFEGASEKAYAQKVGDEQLVPEVQKAFNVAEAGTIFRVSPEPGEEVEAGSTVKVFVSAGFPALAYDDEKDVLLVNGSDGSKLDPIAEGPEEEEDPAWNADASAVAYTSDGQVVLDDLTKPDEAQRELTKKGERFSDLAWAPTANVNVIAMAKFADGTSDLCLMRVGREVNTVCKEEPELAIARKVNWAPDGKSILAFGGKPPDKFGIIRWTTKKPFSANPDDWSAGKLETDTSRPGQGVLDAAISPDGKQMAVVNLDREGPELLLANPGDFKLADAKPLGVRACKVVWRPDGKELVVVRADDCLGSETGELIRVPVRTPKQQVSLKLKGDNPVFQPLAAE